MSQSTINTAAREYANRPQDERFDSPAAMLADAEHDRQYSREVSYNTRDLTVVPTNVDGSIIWKDTGSRPPANTGVTLQLQSPKGTASFTHWSFGGGTLGRDRW